MKRLVLTMMTAALLVSAAPQSEIQNRKQNQQQRIGEGVENGSLTSREAARLERKETRLNRQIHQERRANGGTLTNQQKARIDRQQDRLSRGIRRQKHDAQTQSR